MRLNPMTQELIDAMERTRPNFPVDMWWDDEKANAVINQGVEDGFVFRTSTTQAQWTNLGGIKARAFIHGDDVTKDEVWQTLPNVPVNVNGKIEFCPMRGRRLEFPVVLVGERGKEARIEFAWQTIVNAINNNKALEI